MHLKNFVACVALILHANLWQSLSLLQILLQGGPFPYAMHTHFLEREYATFTQRCASVVAPRKRLDVLKFALEVLGKRDSYEMCSVQHIGHRRLV